MENNIRELIVSEVAKQNGILLDTHDPIFAVVTANKIVLEVYIKALEDKLQENLIELESRQNKYLIDAKELAENKMTAALLEVIKNVKAQEIKSIVNISSEVQKIEAVLTKKFDSKKSDFQWLYFFIVIIISISIGFIIGKMI
ncbi:MAG: hypothetical protein LBD61_02455 [Endomicrobium sp.]|nr:hypothetical protein [Endomicrobium sp.]